MKQSKERIRLKKVDAAHWLNRVLHAPVSKVAMGRLLEVSPQTAACYLKEKSRISEEQWEWNSVLQMWWRLKDWDVLCQMLPNHDREWIKDTVLCALYLQRKAFQPDCWNWNPACVDLTRTLILREIYS